MEWRAYLIIAAASGITIVVALCMSGLGRPLRPLQLDCSLRTHSVVTQSQFMAARLEEKLLRRGRTTVPKPDRTHFRNALCAAIAARDP